MSMLNRSRRSRAFRPGDLGIDHLETRALLAVDPSLVINPDVLGDFDPDNPTLVDTNTFDEHLDELAPAPNEPSELQGGTYASRTALVAFINDQMDAAVTELDLAITTFELLNLKLADVSLKMQDLINATNATMQTVQDPALLELMQNKIDTWEANQDKINDQVFDNCQTIFTLEDLKTKVQNTGRTMINNIAENETDGPGGPMYSYEVDTTAIA